ncbi:MULTISPECIES: GIY-YIG nuclease family protein [unclassified Cedecea]|uniref:GIY-YIG nuclease family protein n=1 Tax=unclassified Cedecea TaxID=2649846 RepID=UPI003016CBC1
MQYVYVMESDAGLIKIGVSKNVSARRKSLQCASGVEIKVAAKFGPLKKAVGLERASHKFFAEKRLHGEWFSVSAEEAISAIDNLKSKFVTAEDSAHVSSELIPAISAAERHLMCLDSAEEVSKTIQLLNESGLLEAADGLSRISQSASMFTRDCMHDCQMALMQKRIDDMVSIMQGAA